MKKLTPFLALLLVAAAGCVTRVETVERPHPPPAVVPRQTVTDKRVMIDPALEHIIQIVGIRSKRGIDGFLKIQLNVQNLTGSIKGFSYRIDCTGGDGEPLRTVVATPFPWTLLAHETSFLAATAPTPEAKDFRITFVAN